MNNHSLQPMILVNKPRLEIMSGDDGIWLRFKPEGSEVSSINLPVFFGRERSTYDSGIYEWSRQFAKLAECPANDANKELGELRLTLDKCRNALLDYLEPESGINEAETIDRLVEIIRLPLERSAMSSVKENQP